MTPRQGLELALAEAGSQSALAKICGCTQGAISQMLKSDNPRLSAAFIPAVSERLGIPKHMLRSDLFDAPRTIVDEAELRRLIREEVRAAFAELSAPAR